MPIEENVTGSIFKLVLDGIPFDAASDANVSQMLSSYETETNASSGQNYHKKTKRPTNFSGVDILCGPTDALKVAELADRKVAFTMSIAEVNGATWMNKGMINMEARETESSKAPVELQPSNNKWKKVSV